MATEGAGSPAATDRPTWCDGQHLIYWIDGGETTLSNPCLLCRRHGRFVHVLGWRLLWGDEGEMLAIKPELGIHGRFIPVAPPLMS